MRWLDGITDSMDMGLGGFRELVMDREAGVLWFMGSQRVGHNWVAELHWPARCRVRGFHTAQDRPSATLVPLRCSVLSDSCVTPWTAPLWDFPDENTRMGCHFVLPGGLPEPGIGSRSPALQADS